MKSKPTQAFLACMLLLALQGIAWSAEPSIHQVYALADSGRVQEAEQLMQQVLRDHPNSAKAHFVEAELLAKQNLLSAARGEFATAERLAPGLPFASRESVQNLRSQLLGGGKSASHGASTAASFSWGPIVVGALVLIVVVMLIRSFMRRRAANSPLNPMSGNAMPMNAAGPFGSGMQQPMSGGGMGSGLIGSLATGAALGAGLVAGEALAHKLMDDDGPQRRSAVSQDNFNGNANDHTNDNMGGNDFGISDSSSWDSSGGDSGGDSGGGWD